MTITSMPVFPGDLGAYTDQAPAFSAVVMAPRMRGAHRGGRKHSGRVRKPNRRYGVLLEKAGRAVGVVSVAFTVGAVLASLAITGGVLL